MGFVAFLVAVVVICDKGTEGVGVTLCPMNSDPLNLTCSCGSQLAKAQCCARYIQGFENAPTPEVLMRSRYTAFSMGTGEAASYLFATHHLGFRSPNLKQDLAEGMEGTRWNSLVICNAVEHGDTGEVEFVASFHHAGSAGQMHEVSLFKREKGVWYYTEGS